LTPLLYIPDNPARLIGASSGSTGHCSLTLNGRQHSKGGFLTRLVMAALITTGVVSACPPFLLAEATQPPKMSACALVPKEEVKKHLPWIPVLDQMAIEEEPIGNGGSSCNYPSVFIQVLPFSQGMIDSARKQGGLEPVSGLPQQQRSICRALRESRQAPADAAGERTQQDRSGEAGRPQFGKDTRRKAALTVPSRIRTAR